MSNKNNPVDNRQVEPRFEEQGIDDARHKRNLRNDAVSKSSPNKVNSNNDKGDPGETPPGVADGANAANNAVHGRSANAGDDTSASGSAGHFERMADKLEKAGNAAKTVGKATKAAGGAAKATAKGAAGAVGAANALNSAAHDPAGAVKQAGAAAGKAVIRAILKKVMAFLAPLMFKLMLILLCILMIIMPFVLIFGLSDSEPSPEQIALNEAARERGDRFDVMDWGDDEQTFDWLVAEMSKAREQLASVTGREARSMTNDILSTYAEKWGAEDEVDYSYRLRYNQSIVDMQKDVAAIICAMYSISQSSGGDNDSYGSGDGDGFMAAADDEDELTSVDVKGDFKSLLRQAQKLAIKTYKVELIYPTGGKTLIYPAGLNIQIGWSNGPYFSGDWTAGIQWFERDNFYNDGRFVEEIEVALVDDEGEPTGETETRTQLTENCVITVNMDVRDDFFDEMVAYFDMEIPDGMNPAAEYQAKKAIYTSAGGWEGYMESALDDERNFDPDDQPTTFESALDAAFHFLYVKGIALDADGVLAGGEGLSFGDIKAAIEQHANNTNSTLVFPGMLPKPVPSYWQQERHLFLEPRNGYLHQGTDTPMGGEAVTAGADGEIVKIVNKFPPGTFSSNGVDARGNLVIIYYGEKEGGIKVYMVFQHMNEVSVSTGDTVTPGTQLGVVGNTGECYGQNGGLHLHTETHYVYNTGGLWTGAKTLDSDAHFNQ